MHFHPPYRKKKPAPPGKKPNFMYEYHTVFSNLGYCSNKKHRRNFTWYSQTNFAKNIKENRYVQNKKWQQSISSDKKENPQSYGLGCVWKQFSQKYFLGAFLLMLKKCLRGYSNSRVRFKNEFFNPYRHIIFEEFWSQWVI